ncbi:MAG: alpha-2-macroglobulin family protein, partial [Sphingobacteriales bacterium]
VDFSEVSYEDAPALALTFTVPIDASQNFNRFIHITTAQNAAVAGEWILAKNGLTAYFQTIEPNSSYQVRVDSGLPLITGASLGNDDGPRSINSRPVAQILEFASQGSVLPFELAEGLPLTTVNVAQADVDFFRLDDAAIPKFLANRQRSHSYNSYNLPTDKTLVYSGRFDLNPPKNKRHVTSLPIGDIDVLRKQSGVYIAVLQRPGVYSYQHQVAWFVISDIGVHVRSYGTQLRVLVNSLADAEALSKTQLSLLRDDGAVIKEAITDSDGVATFEAVPAEAKILLARHGDQIAVLNLRGAALDLSALKLPADRQQQPLNAFIYSPRDLYRPGETVDLSVLLRDGDGKKAATPVLTARILKPDGDSVGDFPLTGNELAYYSHQYKLLKDAPTGLWQFQIMLGDNVLDAYPFHVEEFVPERIKLSLGGDAGADVVPADQPVDFEVKGQYLYGAPAAGNRLITKASLRPLRIPFPNLAGFEFGEVVNEASQQRFDVEDVTLDETGTGTVSIPNNWQNTKSPLDVLAICSLEESGGRAVTRERHFTIWPTEGKAIGIRIQGDPKLIAYNSLVSFDIITVNSAGEKQAAKGLEIQLIRKRRDYYWTRDNDGQYQYSEKSYPVFSANLDTATTAAAQISVPVDYGLYQLEVTDPTSGARSVFPFDASYGWYWGMTPDSIATRPDEVKVLLDKPAYKPGETVHVQVRAPYEGEVIVMVEGDNLLWQKRVTLSSNLAALDIPLSADWQQHNLYVSALVLSPGNASKKIRPQRAVGVTHLALDRSSRKLGVTLALPADKVQPETDVAVKIKVAGATAGKPVMVSLAAVDVGVLNITDFKTPDPMGWLFAPRRYLAELRDIYGDIMNNLNDHTAKIRFGGSDDSAGGLRPITDVQIVALFEQPVIVDANGEAIIPIHVPDFNGRLRLMAVAFGEEQFGNAEQELTVAAPLVTEISLPRFLASGDKAEIALDLHNLSGADREFDISVQASSPLKLNPYKTSLKINDQQRQVIRLPVEAEMSFGTGLITVSAVARDAPAGGDSIALTRQWKLGVRPAYPAFTSSQFTVLKKGESFVLTPPSDNLMPAATRIGLTASSVPPINVQEHIHGLLTYPYGCLEQTTSSTMPWLYATPDAVKRLQLGNIFSSYGAEQLTLASRDEMLKLGMARLASYQLPNGGFGYWGPSGESEWASVYVADFLLDARDMHVPVDDNMLDKLLNRLIQYLGQSGSSGGYSWYEDRNYYDFSFRAYAGYVLSRVNRASLGTLRDLYDRQQQNSKLPLPLMQLGVAMLNQGDKQRGNEAIEKALAFTGEKNTSAYHFYGDYGSLRRDYAWMVYMAEKAQLPSTTRAKLVEKLAAVMDVRSYESTQEQIALLRAALALTNSSGPWTAVLQKDGSKKDFALTEALAESIDFATARRKVQLTNTSDISLYVSSHTRGYLIKAPAEEHTGLSISRTYQTQDDQPLKLEQIKSGEFVKVKLLVKADYRIADALVVDLLPAGFELENQNLVHSAKLDEAPSEEEGEASDNSYYERQKQAALARNIKHQEYRDDRYVAAIDVGDTEEGSPSIELTYLMRAVSAGTFAVPNAFVESMYRPNFRAIGAPWPKVVILPRDTPAERAP